MRQSRNKAISASFLSWHWNVVQHSAFPVENDNERKLMKKIFALSAIAMLGAAPALPQSGDNPSAPQMNSTGTGVTQPGVDARGTAIDRPTGTTGMAPAAVGSERGNNASSLNGSNAASGTYSGANAPSNTDAGRTSGGGAGGGAGGAGGGN